MQTVVGIKFKESGKIYFFDHGDLKLERKDFVIVETVNGQAFAEVVVINRSLPEGELTTPLKKVIRIVTEKDKLKNEENKKKEEGAFKVMLQKIEKYKLDMKVSSVEYTFDNSKLLFYFTANGRIDFRELVKDLALVFKTRIELRQIGVRDEVKMIGGNGVCGRELCCCSFLNTFEAVSIKMAKEQNVSLNPAKISGNCGRLMCCLKYEQEVYEEKISRLPKIGALVKTEDGNGIVEGLETLKESVKVKIRDGESFFYKKYKAEDIEIIKDAEVKHEKVPEDLKKLEQLD